MKRLVSLGMVMVVVAAAGLVSCEKSESTSSAGKAAPIKMTAEARASAIAFGEAIDEELKKGNVDYLLDGFNLEAMIMESFDGEEIPPGFRQEVRKGLAASREQMAAMLAVSRIDFLEFRNDEGYPGLLFRVRVDGGIDYVHYRVRPSKTHVSKWEIIDSFPYMMGIRVSDLLRISFLPGIQDLNRNLFEKLLQGEREGPSLEEMAAVMRLMRESAGQATREEIKEAFEALPDRAKQSRMGRLARIQIWSNFLDSKEDEEAYLEAMTDFSKAHPGDPSLALISIDFHILRGEYKETREVIQTLRQNTGDAYLDFFEGYIDLQESKYADAEEKALAFIESDPEDQDGYDLLLEAGFGQEKHEVTAEALTVLERDFQMDFGGVFEAAEWESFCQSEVGKRWAAARGPVE